MPELSDNEAYLDFGKVYLNIKEYMDKNNIKMSYVSRVAGIKFDVVSNYYHDRIRIYHSSILAKFCYALNCELSDIIIYKNDNKE